MFSQASVILFTTRYLADTPLGRSPWTDTPSGQTPIWADPLLADASGQIPPLGRPPLPPPLTRRQLQRTVRMLLECIHAAIISNIQKSIFAQVPSLSKYRVLCRPIIHILPQNFAVHFI